METREIGTFWIGEVLTQSGFPKGVNTNLVLSAVRDRIYPYSEVSDALSTCFTTFGCSIFPV